MPRRNKVAKEGKRRGMKGAAGIVVWDHAALCLLLLFPLHLGIYVAASSAPLRLPLYIFAFTIGL